MVSSYTLRCLKREHILIALFSFLPIIDAINGYLVFNFGKNGVGIAYHFLLTTAMFLFLFKSHSLRLCFFERSLICLLAIFFANFTLNYLLGIQFDRHSILRTIKIICTFISLVALMRGIKNGLLSTSVLETILEMQSVLVPSVVFLGNISGLANAAYASSNSGKIGFYNSSNEATIVFLVVQVYLLSRLYESFSLRHFIFFLLTTVNLILTESKTGVFFSVVLMFFLIIDNCLRIMRKKKKSKLIVWIIIVLFIGAMLLAVFDNIVFDFIDRQHALFAQYGTQNLLHYLTSGRTTRFNALLFEPLRERFGSGDPKLVLLGIVNLFFGFGFSNGYGDIFEMELFDILLYGGILGWIVFMSVHAMIIWKAFANQKNKLNVIGLMIIIAASFFMGHVWTGGVSGVYFALLSAYLMYKRPVY